MSFNIDVGRYCNGRRLSWSNSLSKSRHEKSHICTTLYWISSISMCRWVWVLSGAYTDHLVVLVVPDDLQVNQSVKSAAPYALILVWNGHYSVFYLPSKRRLWIVIVHWIWGEGRYFVLPLLLYYSMYVWVLIITHQRERYGVENKLYRLLWEHNHTTFYYLFYLQLSKTIV